MANSYLTDLTDLMGAFFRTGPQDFPLADTHGLWYVFSNVEMVIRSTNSTNHSWLRIMGIKVVEKNGIPFDPNVEPLFLRTSNAGEPPECISHKSHPHASTSNCVLNRDSFVWLNVNRHMEPNIRDYRKTAELDVQLHFCIEKDPIFLKSFIFWLSDQGAKFDLSGSGL